MQSTSASQTAFKRHRRWHRSQSCFLVQMHASTNDVSPDDSASRLHMTQMSIARGIREISPVSGYGQMQEDSNCQTKTHAGQLNKAPPRQKVPEKREQLTTGLAVGSRN